MCSETRPNAKPENVSRNFTKRNRMKPIRLILILLVGVILTYLTYKSKYQTFIGTAIIWGILLIIGITLFVWTITKDIKAYNSSKQIKNFTLTFICLIFIAIISILEIKINIDFNKPTLLKAFYDGDFNGTGIDFKKDGTYIFDNSAIGMSDYYYGTYKINGNKITLDKDQIDNLTNLKYLELRENQLEEGKRELYLYQIDINGKKIEQSTEYRITIDNRKK